MRRILLIIFLASVRLTAQDSSTSEVRHILLDAIDKKDHVQLEHLNTTNFRVQLNGQPVRVLSAERVAIKPRVVILMDTSGSMRDPAKWACSINLTKASFAALQSLADVSFAEFSDRTKPQRFVTDPQEITNALKEIEARPRQTSGLGQTALRDTIISAINNLHLRSGDAVLLITDGGENASVESEKKMEEEIFKSGIRVFAILLGGFMTPEERAGLIHTAHFTEKTGGAFEKFGYTGWPFAWPPPPPVERDIMKAIPPFGSYIARRIVLPYILVIESGAAAAGKLEVEAVEPSGKRMKNVLISAPYRLEASTACRQGSGN